MRITIIFCECRAIVDQQLHEFEVTFNGGMYGDFLTREGGREGVRDGGGGGEEKEGSVYVLFRAL